MKQEYRVAAQAGKKQPPQLALGKVGHGGCHVRPVNGFSLMELLVVIIVVSMLAGLGVAGLAGWKRKYDIDNQIRRIHTDLSNVRVMAMTKGRTHFVGLTANGYTVFEDTSPVPDGDDVLTVGVDTVVLRSNQVLNLSTVTNQQFLPIQWSGSAQMIFNSRGLCTTLNTICIPSNVTPRFDCVSIGNTRVALGKLANQGGQCNDANCQIQ